MEDKKKPIAYGFTTCDYCGGLVEFTKAIENISITIKSDGLLVRSLFKSVMLPIESIKDVSFKTNEQISKDVTLTRLLLTGIFAFGLKKQQKVITNYLTIEYDVNGIHSELILKGSNVTKINAWILKVRKDYFIEHPDNKPTENIKIENISDKIKQLSELHDQGILTDQEFDSKKSELLSRI